MWSKLTHIGLHGSYSSQEVQKRVIFNKINVIVFFLFLIIIVSDLINIYTKGRDFTVDLIGNYIIAILCVVHLILNRWYLFDVAKFLALLDIPLILLFFTPLTGTEFLSAYFWGPYAPVVFSVVPYFLFTEKHETKWLYSALIYFFILLLGYDILILSLPTFNPEIVEIIKENYLFYKLIPIIAFVFVNLSMLHAFRLNRKFLDELNKSNIKLEEQNSDLEKLNETKEKFLRIIGHDLKSPISSVVQFCELIELQKEKVDKVEFFDIVNAIKLSGNKSYKLLTDLLTWAQSQSGEIAFSPTVLDLKNAVDENESLFKASLQGKKLKFFKLCRRRFKSLG
ncbi:MAG: hypothetical protein HC831_02585 [Chloroflexia bacterium]|nr:hypothetical protein [Chloroflexia bacterium]